MHAGAQALVHLFPSSSCRYVRSDPKRLWHIMTIADRDKLLLTYVSCIKIGCGAVYNHKILCLGELVKDPDLVEVPEIAIDL